MTDSIAETRDTAPDHPSPIQAPRPSFVPEELETLPPPPPQRHPIIPPAPPAVHRMSPMTQRLVMAGGAGGVGSPSSFPQRPSPGGSLKQLLSLPPGAMQRSASWGAGRLTPTSPYLGSPRLSSPVGGGNPVSSNGFPLIPNLLSNGGASLNASSQARAAMEKAIQAERTRMKEKEHEEKELTAEDLRTILRKERTRMSRLAGEVASLKSTAVACQVEAEVNEEGRINCLMRRLEGLQQEKGRIILELEREEEMLTNNLQKKLNEVKREKAILQQKIEKEQRASAKLKNQLATLDLHQTPITEEGEEEEAGDEDDEESETEEEKQEAE